MTSEGLRILICDDDASTRFAVARLLSRSLTCTLVEAHHGLEALARLDAEPFDLLMLDIEMPEMSGLEVLSAIRASATSRDLPVIMMSRERREEVVRILVHLGIDGYVLKPLRSDKVLAALAPLRERIARRRVALPAVDRPAASEAAAAAVVVDGSAEFRRLFAEQAVAFGPMLEADSGSGLISIYRRTPTAFVFIGQQLGVLDRDRLIPRLRAMSGGRPLRIIGLSANLDDPRADLGGCDDAIGRFEEAGALRAALRRFLPLPGALSATGASVGDIEDCLGETGRQVGTMILDAIVNARMPHGLAIGDWPTPVSARVALTGAPRASLVTLVPEASARWIAGRMFGKTADETAADDVDAAVGEFGVMFAQRIRQWLGDRGMTCDYDVPVVTRGARHAAPNLAACAGSVAFEAPDHAVSLFVTLDVAA